MSVLEGERHDGSPVTPVSAARHIQSNQKTADVLSNCALLKLDAPTGSAVVTNTLWVDSVGALRILAGEPTTAQLAGTTTAIGTIVGGQA